MAGGYEARQVQPHVWALFHLVPNGGPLIVDEEVVYFPTKAAAEKYRIAIERDLTEIPRLRSDYMRQKNAKKPKRKPPLIL